jgi:hypothetical protein
LDFHFSSVIFILKLRRGGSREEPVMAKRSVVLAFAALLLPAPALQARETDRLLPPDTAIILRLDVKALLDAPSLKDDKDALQQAKKIIDGLLAGYDSIRAHMTAAGIDVYRDVAVMTTAIPGDGDPDRAFVVLEGNFDPVQFQKAAEAASRKPDSGLKLIKIGTHDVCEMTLPGREQPLFACLIDKTTILGAGNKDKLAAALELVGKPKAEPPKDAQALLKLLEDKQHLSIAGQRPAVAKMLQHTNLPLGDLLVPVLEGSDTLAGGVNLGKECDLVLRFGCRDDKAAKLYYQQTTLVLAAARGLIAKMAKDNPDYAPLQELMKALKTTTEGPSVVWRSQLSLASAEKLLQNLTK